MRIFILLLLTTATYSFAETKTVNRSTRGHWEKTDTGWTWVANHKWSNGRTATTTGTGQKTDEGRTWNSSTEGTNRNDVDFQGTANGTAVKNDDGTVTVTKDWERTNDNGHVVTGNKERVVTKTDEGREWTTTGSRTGDKGTVSFTGEGSSQKTQNGRVWEASRTNTGPNGREWESSAKGRQKVDRSTGEFKSQRQVKRDRPERTKQNRSKPQRKR